MFDPRGDEAGEFALWGSRFEGGLAGEAAALNRSLPLDRRLWREELEASVAWVEALAAVGVIGWDEARELTDGLDRVGERISAGAIAETDDEDIHTVVERLLTQEVGAAAGKLRTGRSRNDQVATSTRLWTIRATETLEADLRRLQGALVDRAEATLDVLVPSYTHLQRAQPVRLGHLFLAHFWPLVRDRSRWADVRARASVLPLGSAAATGSGFPVDREALAEKLGFRRVTPNSLDAVSDRDFVAEFAFAGALCGAHLARLAEDLIVFASAEFGFIRFSDAYSTGSSVMPQKRNPDVAELARGKAARLLGDVTAALALLKALPSGYNKDLQEDKAILFDVFDTLHAVLPPLAGALETLDVDAAACASALEPALLSVDVADVLVQEGVSFREAHQAVGSWVRICEAEGKTILDADPESARAVHAALPDALAEVGAGQGTEPYERSVERRTVSGGTARSAILAQLAAARAESSG